MMKKVYIRTDGNEVIATGHVMRCLSIAEQLRKLEIEVVFLLADERSCDLIQKRGFRVQVLNTRWDVLEDETEMLIRYIQKYSIEVLLLDSYFVSRKYLQKVSEQTKIIYIDDLNKFVYPVHTVINYGVFAKREDYEDSYQREGREAVFLIGSQFIPLREEFIDAAKDRKLQREMKKVLITTGGTDLLNMSCGLLQMFLGDSKLIGLEYHVIAGCFNQNIKELRKLKKDYENVFLHENVDNMSYWMSNCDAAISAGGSTLLELCACGTPTVCFEIAENQNGSMIWEENGYMIYAGNACAERDKCISACAEALLKYTGSYELRCDCSERMRRLVDGKGAFRIAEYIKAL